MQTVRQQVCAFRTSSHKSQTFDRFEILQPKSVILGHEVKTLWEKNHDFAKVNILRQYYVEKSQYYQNHNFTQTAVTEVMMSSLSLILFAT